MRVKQILIINDGKPGHRNQSLGLAEAIARLQPVEICEREPMGRFEALRLTFGGALPVLEDKPGLLIGAGHATHLTLLALRKLYRVPAIVLMQPSIPMGFFDLCLIPEHDQPPVRPNIMTTRGALNRMQPGTKVPDSGLILVGGPSKHFEWHQQSVLTQVEALLQQQPRNWLVGSSRRTPAQTEAALLALAGDRFVPAATTGPDWLVGQMGKAEVCWVTEDSASMVYEALTAGCKVGVLGLGQRSENRLSGGIAQLTEQGLVACAPDWSMAGLVETQTQFNEAARCADEVLRRMWA